jgi:hypothetical protein
VNAFRRHDSLVIENSSEVITVGKHFRLEREKCSAGVDQVNA